MQDKISIIDQVFDWLDSVEDQSVEALVKHGLLQGWPLNTCTTYHQRWKKHKGKVIKRKQQSASIESLILEAQTANAQCRTSIETALTALERSTAALSVLLSRQTAIQPLQSSAADSGTPAKLTPKQQQEVVMSVAASYPSKEAFMQADPATYKTYAWLVLYGQCKALTWL